MLFFIAIPGGDGMPTKYEARQLLTPADAHVYAEAMQAGLSVDGNDICSWRQACEIAANIEPNGHPGEYMAIDKGANEWPRWDVIRTWKVGDHARMVFHGDGPEVVVVRVSENANRIRVLGPPGPRGGRKQLTFKREGRSDRWKRGAFHLERPKH